DPGAQPPDPRRVRGGCLPHQGVLHQPRAAPSLAPGRLGRRPADRDPLPEPDPVPRDGRERPVSPAPLGRLRPRLHERALPLLALAYALPFSIAGYFILKNREVAA